jgi:hypothetical protein
MALIQTVKDGDWIGLRKALQILQSLRVGQESNPTFTGISLLSNITIDGNATISGSVSIASNLTLSGLTASRLMSVNGSGIVSAVATLTTWIEGTIDHITVTDDTDGSVTLNFDTNTQSVLGAYNGSFLETIDFTISESGGTVTGSLEKDGGGDLIQRFSDGYSTLDCTPAKTIDLTGYVGSDAVPKEVFVYILQSAKTTIAASNSDWPATEHIKIANLVLKSAATTGTDGGALANRNWNDHATGTNDQGHLLHMAERLRQNHAQWKSGVDLTIKDSGGVELTTGNSDTAIELVLAAGEIYQIHKQTWPAFDMYTNATDDAHIVNQPTNEGGAYETTVDLVTDVTHYVDGTDAGVAIGVNKFFNLVIWGVQNRSGEVQSVMINLPTGQYNTEANAISDSNGTSVFSIPSAFKGTGFLIARLTFKLIAGAQWTYVAIEDLRGLAPGTSAGVGLSTSDHGLLTGLTDDDHTQYVLADGTRAMATISVDGTATITGALVVGGTSTLSAALTANSAVNVGQNLQVDGTAIITSTLAVGGIATLSAALAANSNVVVNGTATITGATTIGGIATLSAALAANSNVVINGTATITGATTIGGIATISAAVAANSNVTVGNILTVPNAGLHVLDSNASHDLIITPGSDLTADRILTLTTGDAARTLTLSGNPTLSDWFDQSVKQAASPQFTGIELGHASDTTITRASAGDLNIEGNIIYRAGGTDVPVTDGGTGASTAANARTNLGLGTGDSPTFTGVSADSFTMTGAGQDHKWLHRTGQDFMGFQSQTSAKQMRMVLWTKDGDNTDDVWLRMLSLGLPGSMTNTESFVIRWVASTSNWLIYQVETGTGSARDVEFRAGSGNTDQIRLETGGSIKMSQGPINYTFSMGTSSDDPTTDAPTDWVEVLIAGVTYYLPAYT